MEFLRESELMVGLSLESASFTVGSALIVALAGWSAPTAQAQDEARQNAVDKVVEQVQQGADKASLPVALSIDHARLARRAGSPMPPSTVVMVRDPDLETSWLQADPDLALELPLRVLVHQPTSQPSPRVSRQNGASLLQRHGLRNPSLAGQYDRSMVSLLQQVPNSAVQGVPAFKRAGDGIVSIPSPLDLKETLARVLEIIDEQSDTVLFDVIQFNVTDEAAEQGAPAPVTLVLFGGPGPGGRAMADATLLGLDAFCQKMLIRRDAEGQVVVRFNDLTWIAARQGMGVSPVLQAINTRLINTFGQGLTREQPASK